MPDKFILVPERVYSPKQLRKFVSSHFYQSKLLKNIVPQRYLLSHHVYYFQAPVFKLFDLLFCFYYFPCWFSVFNNTNYS